jgi:peptidoglycan/xylan/chitin deacetylase (PgdA/CDA1 family)
MNSTFTISLDFELHWGGFEKWPLKISNSKFNIGEAETFDQYFLNTRDVIPKMLALFSNYQIHVTWATVGLLMHENKIALMDNIPGSKPTFQNQELSAYHFMEQQGIGENEIEDPFHYADSLIRKIIKTEHQELGSHTFSHFYCNEAGQTIEQFRSDLKAAQMAASKYGIKLKSLVFPRNQFNDDYLKVCFEEGFESVRSNPSDWFWHIESTQAESRWKRLNRGLDAYFPVGNKNSFRLNEIILREGFPVCIPASRLLRPYNPKEYFLNRLKIERVKSEMRNAAKAGECYHLWWHPHNFGNHPAESLNALEEILIFFKKCSNDFGMMSKNMGELASLIKKSNEKKEAA